MKDIDGLFEDAVMEWRNNGGKGTAFIPPPIDDRILIYNILIRMYNKNPDTSVMIVTETFNDRTNVLEFITHTENEDNNKEFKNLIDNKTLRIYTKEFVISKKLSYPQTLVIIYHPISYNYYIGCMAERSKYRLVILNKLLERNESSILFYKLCPLLNCFRQAELDEIRISSPVEDTWVGVDIDETSETWKLYEYYSKYIETSLNIFGNFDSIEQVRRGDSTLNISSAELCNRLARDNGWNEHLDMSMAYNRQIDELYNPNSIYERAGKTYETIRNRNNLLSDYDKKLETILKLVNEHEKEKILIISKRGEFATKVTNYLNNNSEYDICGNYHNKMDDIEAVDEYGNPIYVKSGKEKGKRKVIGWKSQCTLNEKLFNLNKLHCLSLSNAPDKSLNVEVDIVIITSPFCEDIKSYLYRLNNVSIRGKILKLYSIFCLNTTEQTKIMNKEISNNHKIVNKSEFINKIENNFDNFIVD